MSPLARQLECQGECLRVLAPAGKELSRRMTQSAIESLLSLASMGYPEKTTTATKRAEARRLVLSVFRREVGNPLIWFALRIAISIAVQALVNWFLQHEAYVSGMRAVEAT